MFPRLCRATLLVAVLLVSAVRIAVAQDRPSIDHQLACDYATVHADRTHVQVCAFPYGDRLITLAESSVRGHPLLYMTLPSGYTLWAPIARQYMPQSWGTLRGSVFKTIHPRTPPCQVTNDQTTMYYYDSGEGWAAYAVPDGSAYCVGPNAGA